MCATSSHSSKSENSSSTARDKGWMDSLYDRLAEDDEGRVCKGISEKACRETPGNFFKFLVANAFTSVGDKLASAKTTLPWLLSALGSPAWVTSLLVPIREAGAMVPQLWIGAWVRQRAVRKSLWTLGSLLQGLALFVMAWISVSQSGAAAGIGILLCLIGFSLARALSSVAYKDVLGKTIPKTRRGRLSGWISALTGLGSMVVGGMLGWFAKDASINNLTLLLSLSGGLWILAAWVFLQIVEFPGETDGGEEGWSHMLGRLLLLREDRAFRRFVVARALAMGSALAAPFYVSIAREDLGDANRYLGLFLAVEGLAGLLSAPLWGRWADRSSRRVFIVANALASVLTLTVVLVTISNLSAAVAIWFYPAAFFLLGLAHAGVRLGRKTYLVDMADGNQRTDYVVVSNSAMGILLLAGGLIGALLASVSILLALTIFGIAGLLASFIALRWKELNLDNPTS
ncbi:MAG: MFS transporter [Puniceicoccaceae bacterium]